MIPGMFGRAFTLGDVLPLAYVIGGFVLGLVTERLIVPSLAGVLDRRRQHYWARFVGAWHGAAFVSLLAVGAYAAALAYHPAPRLAAAWDRTLIVVLVAMFTLVIGRR